MFQLDIVNFCRQYQVKIFLFLKTGKLRQLKINGIGVLVTIDSNC